MVSLLIETVESHWQYVPLGLSKLFILVPQEVKKRRKDRQREVAWPEGLNLGSM